MSETTDPLVELNAQVMDRLAAGVAVMTMVDDDAVRRGMTISSLTPVSADPPSVLMCIGSAAGSRAAMVPGRTFCANVLAADQVGHSVGFAWGEEDPFSVFEWEPAPDGTPILAGTVAHLLCEIEDVVEHHGTAIVLAKPTGGAVHKDEALVYWMKHYYVDLVREPEGTTGDW